MALGLLQPGGSQYYQTSGQATEQEQLPEKYKSTNVAPSPLTDQLKMPPDWLPYNSTRRAPVVQRRPRMNGMRYLYSRKILRQPYERLGTPGGNPQKPYMSAFQPNDMGPIRDAGFNDALYQAGYPGFNLGLSFKVPRVLAPGEGRKNAGLSQGGPQVISGNRKIVRVIRASGAPPTAK